MKTFALAIVLLAACGSDPLYDPTGHWSTTLSWGAGNCGLQGDSSETLELVELADGRFQVRDLSNSNASVSGTVHTTQDNAVITISSVDPDILRDGGSTTGTLAMHATADENMVISGTGSISTSGFFVCSQAFTAVGVLTPLP
jgi:hypothetical protein